MAHEAIRYVFEHGIEKIKDSLLVLPEKMEKEIRQEYGNTKRTNPLYIVNVLSTFLDGEVEAIQKSSQVALLDDPRKSAAAKKLQQFVVYVGQVLKLLLMICDVRNGKIIFPDQEEL